MSLACLGCRILQAQLSTASLSGTITDPSAARIPAATLTLESTLQKYVREAVTSGAGSYLIPAIPPGRYKLTVRKARFQAEAVAEFGLSSGHSTARFREKRKSGLLHLTAMMDERIAPRPGEHWWRITPNTGRR